MTVLLSLATVVAIAVGYWNLRASFRAGRGADWRINRDGLRAPGTTPDFNRLHLLAWPVLIAFVVFHASLTAVLAAALAYAIGFAALANRERHRAVRYYRGNVFERS
jgi:Na+/H+ antiporter NhaD/arsenite permease-like protein